MNPVHIGSTMWTSISGLFSIVLIDLVLSGDNALVIGMACAGLPPEQRRRGVLYGSLAAVGMRVALAASATLLLEVPLLRSIGGLLLIWIAFKLTVQSHGDHQVKQGATLWEAVKTIALADLVMSLDNVLAVGGVSRGNIGLLIFGLGLTIPIIMWGSTIVAQILSRAPWLTYFGAAVLAWTAGSMIAEDPAVAVPGAHLLPVLAPAVILLLAAFEKSRRPAP